MMDARKLLINLLYLATAQSSELPGWSHRETKKGAPEGAFFIVNRRCLSEHDQVVAMHQFGVGHAAEDARDLR